MRQRFADVHSSPSCRDHNVPEGFMEHGLCYYFRPRAEITADFRRARDRICVDVPTWEETKPMEHCYTTAELFKGADEAEKIKERHYRDALRAVLQGQVSNRQAEAFTQELFEELVQSHDGGYSYIKDKPSLLDAVWKKSRKKSNLEEILNHGVSGMPVFSEMRHFRCYPYTLPKADCVQCT